MEGIKAFEEGEQVVKRKNKGFCENDPQVEGSGKRMSEENRYGLQQRRDKTTVYVELN